jgi:hypothetical protein
MELVLRRGDTVVATGKGDGGGGEYGGGDGGCDAVMLVVVARDPMMAVVG